VETAKNIVLLYHLYRPRGHVWRGKKQRATQVFQLVGKEMRSSATNVPVTSFLKSSLSDND
jgi:hypothetical protein